MRAGIARILFMPFRTVAELPVVRRVGYHVRRVRAGLDIHFFRTPTVATAVIVAVSAFLATVLEPEKRSMRGLVGWGHRAVTTGIGSSDAADVTSPGGHLIGWLLSFVGVAIVAAITAAVVGFVIRGRGLGALPGRAAPGLRGPQLWRTARHGCGATTTRPSSPWHGTAAA